MEQEISKHPKYVNSQSRCSFFLIENPLVLNPYAQSFPLCLLVPPYLSPLCLVITPMLSCPTSSPFNKLPYHTPSPSMKPHIPHFNTLSKVSIHLCDAHLWMKHFVTNAMIQRYIVTQSIEKQKIQHNELEKFLFRIKKLEGKHREIEFENCYQHGVLQSH